MKGLRFAMLTGLRDGQRLLPQVYSGQDASELGLERRKGSDGPLADNEYQEENP